MLVRFRSLLVLLTTLTLASPAAAILPLPPPPDPAEIGPFGVGHSLFELVDPEREDRLLSVDLWYPTDPEDAQGELSFYELLDIIILILGLDSDVAFEDAPVTSQLFRPLVVFSHGSGGLSTQSFRTMETLASHGFVVAAPNHTGNTIFDSLNGTEDPLLQSAIDRPQDVSLLIDDLLARSFDPGDPLFLRINPFAIGVAGHSFGGFTSLAIAGGFGDIPADPRVRAIAPIAPASSFLSDEELASIEVPTFLLSGTDDNVTPLDPETTRPFALVGSRFLYRADIVTASHFHFAVICDIADALIEVGISPDLWPAIGAGGLTEPYEDTCLPEVFPIEEAIRIQNQYLVSFFRRHLVWDLRYAAFLTEEFAAIFEPDVDFFRNVPRGCGLGAELAVVLPLLLAGRRRFSQRVRRSST